LEVAVKVRVGVRFEFTVGIWFGGRVNLDI